MAQHSKQSVVSATGSGPSVFFWARLKLTAIYVLIVAVILFGFSVFLLQSFQRNLTDADEGDFAGPDSHQHFVQNTVNNVENEIILIDLVILVLSAGVSYVLAGYTLRPIEDALEAQRAFSENASHELRTPLAVMRNDMEVLLRNPYPTKELIETTLRDGVEEVDRMTKMTEDLLAIARSQNHKTLRADIVDLTQVVQKTTQKIQPIAQKKNISLSVSGDTIKVRGDARSLERALVNLLQNAIEHTPPKGSVEVAMVREGSKVVWAVSDTGAGIDPKDLPHVFERFYKGRGASGSGLGLSIVRALITQYGGEVSIASTKGKGTTVTIILPAA